MNIDELVRRIVILENAVAGLAMSNGFADGFLPLLKEMVAKGETAALPLVTAIENIMNSSAAPDA